MSSNQPDRRGKRLAASGDFEKDDEFEFTRKPKKARTEQVAAETSAAAPVRRSPRNKAPGPGTGATEATSRQSASRTVASPSRDAERRRREASAAAARSSRDRKTEKPTTTTSKTTAGGSSSSSRQRADANSRHRSPSPNATTMIVLPTSDTPVIARNREMRKKAAEGTSPSSSNGNGNRRSSLRGRRGSSLMESGQAAMPHREVDAREFYKHISPDDRLEHLRMKQLLTWCGERALPEMPRGLPITDPRLGAQPLLRELAKEFATRPEFSNWMGRDESVAPAARILRPNPRNIELDRKMASLEARIKRLQQEKNAWQAIQKPPPDQPQLFPQQTDDQSIELETQVTLPDYDLLDADEGRIYKYLSAELEPLPAVRARTEARLKAVRAKLEFEADCLADSVHKLEQRVRVAGRQADVALRTAAERLKRREERERKAAGTREMPMMEVLRSLGSLLPEGGGGGGGMG